MPPLVVAGPWDRRPSCPARPRVTHAIRTTVRNVRR
ncbi:hypothetical protein STVIR_4358 [Streptomyces viridochromogenes Tue57]|uniref:Uncharacterized protein n=1 Tax=Streptomyces viridochromogenes Tue57 TaxID=1160705 RepID=L8PE57_STRVR|nr:hypothetical protein STVIR_4358 [Streptomyces viridochromogenes Tue57]